MRKTSKRTKVANLKRDPRFLTLTPQSRTILTHLNNTGTITQREALLDHSVQSLTRRITEIRDAGFNVGGEWKIHPVTEQRYMRYSFAG